MEGKDEVTSSYFGFGGDEEGHIRYLDREYLGQNKSQLSFPQESKFEVTVESRGLLVCNCVLSTCARPVTTGHCAPERNLLVAMASMLFSTLDRAKFLLLLTLPTLAQNGSVDPFQYVDPLIGTINGGHVFPGATLPFGMAKAVADVNGEAQGGYASDNSDSE